MNGLEKRAAAHLVELRDRFGVRDVKVEFEAQGAELAEVQILNKIAASAGMGVVLKIGGAEDVWGIKQALLVGVSGIVFPMVETAYALSKSLGAAKEFITPEEREDIRLAVNIETKVACENLPAILEVAKNGGLDAVTLGRVDLVGSLDLGREYINSEQVFNIAHKVCALVKQAGIEMTIGGGIEAESQTFLEMLVHRALLDRFETRMIIFPADVVSVQSQYENAVREAHRFEMLWLECLSHKYSTLARQHEKRIGMLKKRVGEKQEV
jgi:2-keto-3-deoxy-L-rhamnonate aldolase RhmA